MKVLMQKVWKFVTIKQFEEIWHDQLHITSSLLINTILLSFKKQLQTLKSQGYVSILFQL